MTTTMVLAPTSNHLEAAVAPDASAPAGAAPQQTQETQRSGAKRLEALDQRLRGAVSTLEREQGERDSYGGDFESLVGAAQLASQRETEHMLAGRLKQRLDKLEDVRRLVEQGRYGLCGSCGEQIPAERLEAVPDARRCMSCQQRSERIHGRRRAA